MGETVSKVDKTIREDAMPRLNSAYNQAYEDISTHGPKRLHQVHSVIYKLTAPFFDHAERASPEHSKEMPKLVVDRVLLLIIILFILYQSLWIVARLFNCTA